MRIIEIPPKPSPLIESIRAIGYSLSTALADLVDNSIAARAATIQILTSLKTPDLKIGILDDGLGMTEEELLEAMRLGSRSPLEERAQSDLGRFGLGLKTASFSQCRMLTVVTRTNGATASAQWDLDRIAESGKWQVHLPDDPTSIPWVELLGEIGTLVVWEELGLGTDNGYSGRNLADFVRQMDEGRSHLELVFHRFLSGESGRRKVNIQMNNRSLEPFESIPFQTSGDGCRPQRTDSSRSRGSAGAGRLPSRTMGRLRLQSGNAMRDRRATSGTKASTFTGKDG